MDKVGPTGRRVAQRVNELRRERGLTLSDLEGKLAELGRPMVLSALSKIENGQRRVDTDDLVALALALGVSPVALLLPSRHASASVEVDLTPMARSGCESAWRWALQDDVLPAGDDATDQPGADEPEPRVLTSRTRGTISHAPLGEDTQRRLIAAGTTRRWSPGQMLIREHESVGHVVLLTEGRVKVSSAAPSGRQVLLAIRGPGDLLGEFAAIDAEMSSVTVTALTNVSGVSLSKAEFGKVVATNPSATADLLKMVVGRLRESSRRRIESGAYDVLSRTARLLIEFATAYGEPTAGGLTVQLRQSELAQAAGASREAVAKALKVFREAGAIRTNRTSFDVLDIDRLRRFTDPQY